MRVFVTGATGFVGRAVVPKLAASEHQLRCLVRASSVTAGLERAGAELVRGDVTVRDSLAPAMAGCDCVVDLANLYSLWEPDPSLYARVNIDGTRIVCECAGTTVPRLRIPDWLAMPTARLLTLVADLTKRPPLWGMAADAVRMGIEGVRADGTKAERELGVSYTPLRQALKDCVHSLGERPREL